VKNRIMTAWQKWKELSGVVCDRNMLESKEKSAKQLLDLC